MPEPVGRPMCSVPRRTVLGWLAAPAAVIATSAPHAIAQAPVYRLDIRRDAACGCCHAWADIMKASAQLRVTMAEEPDMAAFKQKLGVPARLASCHTATIDGYVVEGHVPLEDILRLVAERPAGVKGIAAPGMPRGGAVRPMLTSLW